MSWLQKEKVIREKRTIEATKKNLMGQVGKFAVIAKNLGTPIIRQGSSFLDATFLDDPFDDFSDAEFESTASGQAGPMMYQDKITETSDQTVTEEGYLFDGLSRGMHLEIKAWNENGKIEVSYKGHSVYKEIAGELYGYAPSDEWEQLIHKLYRVAQDRRKDIKKIQEQEIGEIIRKEKLSFLDKLRYRWGI